MTEVMIGQKRYFQVLRSLYSEFWPWRKVKCQGSLRNSIFEFSIDMFQNVVVGLIGGKKDAYIFFRTF